MDKYSLRRDFILKRKSLSPKVVDAKSHKVFENFKVCNFKEEIKKTLVYLPINNEVDTKLLLEYLIQKNIDLFLPTYINRMWIISKFVDDEALTDGPHGTRQPILVKKVDVENLDLAIVPGVAFSKDGFRLGYGKGVYDKLLNNFSGIKVGLVYDFQIVNNFSPEDHDVKMDYLITESRIIEVLSPNK